MKPRVLLVSTIHPATDPRIFYKMAPSLSKRFEVFCALPDIQSQVNDDFEMISLPKFKQLFLRLIISQPVLLWKCIRLKPRIVHICVPELIPAALLFQILGAKVIYEVQENLFKKFDIKRSNNAYVYRRCFKFFDSIARKRFHCIFTDEAYLLEYKNLERSFAIVRNFVSLPFVDAIPDQKSVAPARYEFFYAGVISLERCLDVLLEALYALKQKYADFHLHLFGTIRIDPKALEALPYYQSVSGNITFYGYTDQKVALGFARQCIAGIALLKPVADYQESYTTKLFEYMALHLPVITSDFQLYRKVVEHSQCGFCILPYDARMLSEKLIWMIENTAGRTTMGINGRMAVEKMYNWAREEQALFSFYETLLTR